MTTNVQLYDLFDTLTSVTSPPQLPRGGTVVLFEFTDDEKKEDWRADGYRWRQNGTKKVKCGDGVMQKIFFQVRTPTYCYNSMY